MRLLHHRGEQLAEHRARPQRIGIGQGRARHRMGAEMIKAHGMALQPALDLTQARGARELRIKQRRELALRRQPAHPRIGLVHLDQPLELGPRHML